MKNSKKKINSISSKPDKTILINKWELHDIILEFERQCNPFKYQIQDFCIWPLFRFLTYEHLKINSNSYNKREMISRADKTSTFIKVFFYLKDIINFFRLCKHEKYELLGITEDNRLRERINNIYLNYVFDYFDPPLENILYLYNTRMCENRLKHYPKPFISERILYSGSIFYFLEHKEDINALEKLYKDFLGFLEKYDYKYYYTISFREWRKILKKFLIKMTAAKIIFKILSPKIILIECSYGKEWAVAAAKSLKIPIWELQHGIIHNTHMAYLYDKDSAQKYKHQLPLPDKILTFGDYFSQILTERNFWNREDVPAIGLAKFEYIRKKFTYRLPQNSGTIAILLSSQWILAEKLISFIKETIPHLPTNTFFLVKTHPRESKNQIKKYEMLGDKVTVIKETHDFYEAVSNCHIHCAVFSTTLFESIGLGIPTIILNLPGVENVSILIEKGYAKFASTPLEFIDIIKNCENQNNYLKEWHTKTLQAQTHLWETGVGEKLRQLINSI